MTIVVGVGRIVTMTKDSFRLGYRPALDGLRGFAILVVVFFHYKVPGFEGGFLGVDIFFILSGFLITSLLLQEWQFSNTISLSKFYARRFLRLIPALLFFLIPLFRVERLDYILYSLFYIYNWAVAYNPTLTRESYVGVTWSLSVEEQFYLFWPALLLLQLRFGASRLSIAVTSAVIILASTAQRHILAGSGASFDRIYYGTDVRLAEIISGALLAVLVSQPSVWLWMRSSKFTRIIGWPAFCVNIIIIAITRSGAKEFLLFFDPFLITTSLLILNLLLTPQHSQLTSFFSFRPIVWIGKISYSLYLWHWSVHHFLHQVGLTLDNPYMVVARLIISFILAALSYYIIERPFLRMKSRFTVYPTSQPLANVIAD